MVTAQQTNLLPENKSKTTPLFPKVYITYILDHFAMLTFLQLQNYCTILECITPFGSDGSSHISGYRHPRLYLVLKLVQRDVEMQSILGPDQPWKHSVSG